MAAVGEGGVPISALLDASLTLKLTSAAPDEPGSSFHPRAAEPTVADQVRAASVDPTTFGQLQVSRTFFLE